MSGISICLVLSFIASATSVEVSSFDAISDSELASLPVDAAAGANKFIWKDCGSELATIDDVAFKGCAHSSHMGCRIVRGTNVTAAVTFTVSPSAPIIKAAETKIHAVIVHVPIPWSPDNVDACKGCGLQCPLQQKQQYTYSLSLHVKKVYPSIRATIEWEVVDQDSGKDVFCFKAPIVVV